MVDVEKCPTCGKIEFYLHTDSRTQAQWKSCAYCKHTMNLYNPTDNLAMKEKKERMDQLKQSGSSNNSNKPKVGVDPRFPVKPQWKEKDEKRREYIKKVVKVQPKRKVPKPYTIE